MKSLAALTPLTISSLAFRIFHASTFSTCIRCFYKRYLDS